VVDRDRVREKFADWAAARVSADRPMGDGPLFAWRPWRLAAGVALGLACATKWSGLYAVAVFGLMTVVWEISARRTAGIRSPVLNTLLRDGPVAFVTIIGPALLTYLVSWSGWISAENSWGRQWRSEEHTSELQSRENL